MEKLPPVEKIYEAWTAIADNRVQLDKDSARVTSSDGAKSYLVRFNDNIYTSNDNATFWQGYAGYPVIAVLMLQDRLPFDPNEAELWKDINWTELNKKHRNNYAKAVQEIAAQKDIDMNHAGKEAENVMEHLKALPIEIKRKL